MSNQVLLWFGFIAPWMTLLLMKKEDVKRFMPVALLTVISGVLVTEAGVGTGLWSVRETTFPLVMTPTYIFGTMPVVAMWVFKFTYGRFWLFVIAELVANFAYTFFLKPWLASRGILSLLSANITGFYIAGINSLLLYGYQMWQEDALVPALKNFFSTKPQPVAAKPIFKNENDRENND